MARESKSRYALLGLLSQRPMSGYDLRKAFSESVMHFWNESYGRIYPLLGELTAQGLVTARDGQRGGRARNVYSITAAGRAALRGWLREPPAAAQQRNELLLKLFFTARSDPSIGARHVRAYRERLHRTLETYEDIRRMLEAAPPSAERPYWLITLSQGLHATRALLAWSDETLAVLASLAADKATRAKKRHP